MKKSSIIFALAALLVALGALAASLIFMPGSRMADVISSGEALVVGLGCEKLQPGRLFESSDPGALITSTNRRANRLTGVCGMLLWLSQTTPAEDASSAMRHNPGYPCRR